MLGAERIPSRCVRFSLLREPCIHPTKHYVAVPMFSGDKRLGGLQAGLMVGHKHVILLINCNPLRRVLLLCKRPLAALKAELRSFLDPDRLAERLLVPWLFPTIVLASDFISRANPVGLMSLRLAGDRYPGDGGTGLQCDCGAMAEPGGRDWVPAEA